MRGLVLALLLLAVPGIAHADDDDKPQVQKMKFVERGDSLYVTTSIGKLFDFAAFQGLTTGFASTVAIQIWVYPKDSREPIAITSLVRSAVWDVWDEVYTVKTCKTCTAQKVKSPAEVLKLLTSIDDFPVAKLADIPYEDIYTLALRADLNPVSKETLTEVRRWLSQSSGGIDRGGVFFGSFVSAFVNPKIAPADRVLRVVSTFYRPTPAPAAKP
jgi:hypothetical protein